jgi:hypothetical protein
MSSIVIIPAWGRISGLAGGALKSSFKGGWNPQTNSPDIYTSCVQIGDFVVVQDVGAGNTYTFDFGSKGGQIDLSDSDQVVFNGVIFVKNEQFNRDAQEIEMDRLTPSLGSVYANIITNKNNITILQSGKEPSITGGTISQYWRGDKTWQALNKSAVGLSNVDNTSDLNKPISTATQTALNARQITSQKGQANGYAPLDALSKVPKINTYPPSWGEIEGVLDDQTDLKLSLDQKKNIPTPLIFEKWSTPRYQTFPAAPVDTTPRQEKVGIVIKLPAGYYDFKSNPTSFVVMELYKQKKRYKRNANGDKIKSIITKGFAMTGHPYQQIIGLDFSSTQMSSLFSGVGFGELGMAQNRYMITRMALSHARSIHKIDNNDFKNCIYYPPNFVGNFDQGSQDVSALTNVNDYLLVTDVGYIDQLRINLMPGDHIYLDEFFSVRHWRPSTTDTTGTIEYEINPTIFFRQPLSTLPVQLSDFNSNVDYRIKTGAVSNSAWGNQRTKKMYYNGSDFLKTPALHCKTHSIMIRFRLGCIIDKKVHFGDASDVLKIKLRRITTDPNDINRDYFVKWDIL